MRSRLLERARRWRTKIESLNARRRVSVERPERIESEGGEGKIAKITEIEAKRQYAARQKKEEEEEENEKKRRRGKKL